jgi:clan AA aspartic protease (TIGR02281 family)
VDCGKKSKIHVVKCGDAICGTLVWLEEPIDPQTNRPKTDKNNSDVAERGRLLLGLPILLNIYPDGSADKWEGPIYNAEDGNTYPASLTLYGSNIARLKACGLGGLICKQQVWTRAAAPPTEIPPIGATLKGVPLKKAGGTFIVPVQINGAITLGFTVDSRAADVSIPADVFSTLVRTGTIGTADIVGERAYVLADGTTRKAPTFIIKSLKVGDRLIENVRGSVTSSQGSLLLGQSFLERFKSWSVDSTKHVLLLEPR